MPCCELTNKNQLDGGEREIVKYLLRNGGVWNIGGINEQCLDYGIWFTNLLAGNVLSSPAHTVDNVGFVSRNLRT